MFLAQTWNMQKHEMAEVKARFLAAQAGAEPAERQDQQEEAE
jgi:hypothetical protein